MSYTILPHVATGDLATAALHNTLLDDVAIIKTSIDDNGHLIYPTIITKSTTYAILAGDDVILCDASGGGFPVTLPSAVAPRNGKPYNIKKTDATANLVTVATTSSQLIDGASTFVIRFSKQSITVVSDGTNWQII